MFWRAARRKYGHLAEDDEDIRKYLALSGEFQSAAYGGLVGYIQDLGHRWVSRRTPPGPVLEIGSGSGRHFQFFRHDRRDFYPSEYAPRFITADVRSRFRGFGVCCDARHLPYASGSFETVISIYNLEHIEELQAVCSEVHRVLTPTGKFLVALPCEGGLAWNLGREVTTRPAFRRQYGIDYDKIIAWEHVHDLPGVIRALRESGLFRIEKQQMLPFRLFGYHANLIGVVELSVIAASPSV